MWTTFIWVMIETKNDSCEFVNKFSYSIKYLATISFQYYSLRYFLIIFSQIKMFSFLFL
jgi:hypothetical protein